MRTLRHTDSPTAVDIFAGIGGLSHGFQAAGCRIVAAIESDPVLAATYEANYPEHNMILSDIREVDPTMILQRANLEQGELTFLIGGPPCQGFSYIGKRNPGDARNELLKEYVRFLKGLQPEFFVLENVPGLLSSGNHFSTLLEDLETAGYRNVRSEVMDASWAGVPQRRKRLIVYGTRDLASLPSLEKASRRLPPTVAEALGDLPDPSKAMEEFGPASRVPYAASAATSYVKELRGRARLVSRWHPVIHSSRITGLYAALKPGKTDPITKCWRLKGDGLSRTLRAGSHTRTACRPVHHRDPRVITIREAARLHSFPDSFELPRRVSSAHMGIGNSVPPMMARVIAGMLLQHAGRTDLASESH